MSGVSRDHNDVSIDALTKRYADAVNSLISCTVRNALLQKVSASLRADMASSSPSTSSGHVGAVADTVMQYTQILLQNSTQNYAILRKHLSQDCPDFVPHLVLPRLFGLLTQAEEEADSHLRPIMTVLSLVTVITFKVKTMRKHIARAEIAKQVLNSNGGGVLGRRPHVLAMLVKLQVNIEGGFGPTWKQEHATTVKLLSKSIGKALESPASVLAFRDALHNHQAVPCNKGSRAFAALAFAWRINSLHDVEVLVQTVAEREGIEGTKSDVQASMATALSVEGGSGRELEAW